MRISETASISIEAPPDAVLDLVGDPLALPRWAPAFAPAVRPGDDGTWIVDSGEGELHIRVRVSRELGTVDFLAAGRDVGAFSRVVANGSGSEYLFTQFYEADETHAGAAGRRAVVAAELETVRALCEQG
jgi:Polyketide cyclase / dehydrase and lipid transport